MLLRRCALHNIFFLITFVIFPSLLISTADAEAMEAAFLGVVINDEDAGVLYVLIQPDGDIWVKRDELGETRLKREIGEDVEFKGEAFVPLSSISGLSFMINESEASLEIQAIPDAFEEQVVDISYEKRTSVVWTRNNSAFLNYSLFYDSGGSSLDISTELGVRAGDYLGTSTFNYRKSDYEDKFIRLLTSLSSDDRMTMKTLRFGDITASSGIMGSSIIMGGAGISRNFEINPYFIRYPSLSLEGVAYAPSEVEIYINDMLIKRSKVAAGLFTLEKVPASVGMGSAKLVIKDMHGEERVISKRFLFSDKMLKEGLHEYRYNLGFKRKSLGEKSFHYDEPVFLSFHNYGFSNRFKAGYALEASDDVINIGPSASMLVAEFGTLDAAFSISTSTGKFGYGGFLGYLFPSSYLSVSVSYAYRSRDYSNITYTPEDDKPSIFRISAGLSRKWLGSLSASYQMTDMYNEPTVSSTTLFFNRPLIKSATFLAIGSRAEREGEEPEYEVFLGVHAYFGGNITGSISHTDGESGNTTTATFQKSLPSGRGYGYRADVESSDDELNLGANFKYQNDYGTYGLRYNRQEEEDNIIISSEGGIGYIDGTVFVSRRINDSFAKVNVGDVEGVRVYYFQDEAGRTDKKGEAIITDVRSFHENRISIETRDIPPDYSISSMTKYISPPSRSGSIVKFDVMKVQGITGHIFVDSDGKKAPVEFAFIHVSVEDGIIEGMIGRAGEFYIENVPPGTHPARVKYLGKDCLFDIIIPESEDLFVNLGEIACEMEE